jgi:hypothetical protein
MERLFSPCTRCIDVLESQGILERNRGYYEFLEERNLDVSIEELLSVESAFTYADVYAMLENEDTRVWLTPHALSCAQVGEGCTISCGRLRRAASVSMPTVMK